LKQKQRCDGGIDSKCVWIILELRIVTVRAWGGWIKDGQNVATDPSTVL